MELLKVLRSVGLNIFPEPDSEKFVTITNKVNNDRIYTAYMT